MLVVWLSQALFAVAALVLCAATCFAILRRDPRAHFRLTLAGSLALIFFVTVPGARLEMIGVAALAILAGTLMTPSAPVPARRR